ncbi:hypothetical protein PoB_007569000 [Plakobranchus ocellatus]|uniref:Uncharacterized protein n=1 Tax=Plakobranchus ocellatus TaxID=259542 RepID=A0AAV4DYP9_9GAST|nr:hypothetical protein PoB_007569000 [Plakobranchus ocellatus]
MALVSCVVIILVDQRQVRRVGISIGPDQRKARRLGVAKAHALTNGRPASQQMRVNDHITVVTDSGRQRYEGEKRPPLDETLHIKPERYSTHGRHENSCDQDGWRLKNLRSSLD